MRSPGGGGEHTWGEGRTEGVRGRVLGTVEREGDCPVAALPGAGPSPRTLCALLSAPKKLTGRCLELQSLPPMGCDYALGVSFLFSLFLITRNFSAHLCFCF